MSRKPSATQSIGRFAAAVVGAPETVPPGLGAWNGGSVERRFGVYRNNVREGLIGALASRFPVTEKLVGRAFFSALAEAFLLSHPPRSPVLMEWGDALPAFIETFEPAATVPYLADVARLEAARSHAYHAADAAPVQPETLAALDSERLALVRLVSHPALAILRSPYPVLTIWERNTGDSEPAPLELGGGEDMLVTRPQMRVELRPLPPGAARFFEALEEGQSIGWAAEAAHAETPLFDLTLAFTLMIQSGAFSAVAEET